MGIRTGKPKGRPKGSKSKRTVEREAMVQRAAKAIEDLLPEPFKGDAHAYLMSVYKNVEADRRDRMTAAIGALPYEKPKLSSVELKGDEENPLAYRNVSDVDRPGRESREEFIARRQSEIETPTQH